MNDPHIAQQSENQNIKNAPMIQNPLQALKSALDIAGDSNTDRCFIAAALKIKTLAEKTEKSV